MTDVTTGKFDDGEGYERLMGRWSRAAGTDFLAWCNVPPGKVWLDVGCGNGAFTGEIMARMHPSSVTGLDPAPAQIAYARTRPETRGAEFQLGDAMNLTIATASVDAAVMALVIAFVPDPVRAVAELKRVTKPGGLVATYMWDLPNGGVHLAPFYQALKDMGTPGPMPPSAQASEMGALTQLWRDAGLKNIASKTIRVPVHFDSFDDFWDSNTVPVGPQAERLKTLTKEQIDELRNRLRAIVPIAANGSIAYAAFANAVKGTA